MPQLSITTNGTSAAMELPLEQDYKVKLQGTIDVGAVFTLEYATIGQSDWSQFRATVDSDPATIGAASRAMLVAGGLQLRVVTTGFGASTDVIIDVSAWGDARKQQIVEAAIIARKVLVENVEYTFENQVSSGIDRVVISETV
jgi:hypothetical protein